MRNGFSSAAGMAILTLAASAVSLGAARADGSVTYQGQKISSSVVVINGSPYITLSDAAKLVHGSARHTADGYIIVSSGGSSSSGVPAGGANQIAGHNGSLGQMLFTGKWKFEAVSVNITSSYNTVYASTSDTINPNGDNDELVVVNCIIKNAKTQEAQPIMRDANPGSTAVTDDGGASYPPVEYDFPGGSGYGPEMLPGSTTKFAVVFDVPKSTHIEDLIFDIYDLDQTSDTTIFRINLKQ